jgi:ribose transport system ATP-binding protein
MEGVRKSFGATVALGGVDLSVLPGEVHALVGENGAGKSTLMKVLSGAHLPDAGRMWLDGQPYEPKDPAQGRRAGVAMIYQELSLAPDMTVAENVLLGVEPTSRGVLNWRQMRRVAADALAQIGRPDIHPDTPVRRLSVAQQQLVEIARCLAVGSRVLVLDEPTSTLGQADIVRLFALIRRLQSSGISIIYISHFLEEVREICQRFTVLRDGQTVGTGVTAEVPTSRIVSMMVGRDVHDLYPRSVHTPGEVVLEVTNLASGKKPTDASLQLRRGQVLGIAGLVGAGRTELIRSIFGLLPVTSGQVRIGTLSGAANPTRRWSQGIGMVSEDRKSEGLALNLSIADNLTLTKLDHMGPMGLVTPSAQDAASRGWISKLSIKCASPRQPVGALSGGNQQKVAIGRLLHHDVDVLLLDEPTRGIDVASKAQIYRLIDELATGDPATGRKPRAVLMISSYLPELLGVCDRIAVMCRGVLGEARDVGELDEHQIMLQATGTAQTLETH